jgi:predicted dehydrogenase
MTSPIRIGVIGCGDVMTAYMYHAQLLRGQGLVEVTWASDLRPEREKFMRERYGVPNFTRDYRRLLDSDEVDLVLVLTSMAEHGRLALEALQAGKHVLVEKPMSIDLAEAARLVDLSRSSRGHLLCAPFVMLSPTYQTIWYRLQRGDIGKALTARARYGHSGPTWGPWFYRRGGGPIFDLAPYNLTSLTGLLGPVKRVSAMTGTALPVRQVDGQPVPVEVEDNAHLLLDFGGSVLAAVTTGFTLQQYRGPALELYGASGTIQMLGDDWDPEGYELWQNELGAWQVYKETDPGWLWTDGLRHIVACIREGKAPLLAPEQAYHVLEVMVKAGESGRDGQVKTIDSAFPPPGFAIDLDIGQVHLAHDRTHKREED